MAKLGTSVYINICASITKHYFDDILQQHGIKATQGIIIQTISRLQPVAPITIGHKLHLKKPTVTEHVKTLEALGYIKREPSEIDKRQIILTLTEKGIKLREDIRERVNELEHTLFETFSPEEKATFEKLLLKFIRGQEDKLGKELHSHE